MPICSLFRHVAELLGYGRTSSESPSSSQGTQTQRPAPSRWPVYNLPPPGLYASSITHPLLYQLLNHISWHPGPLGTSKIYMSLRRILVKTRASAGLCGNWHSSSQLAVLRTLTPLVIPTLFEVSCQPILPTYHPRSFYLLGICPTSEHVHRSQ